MHLRQGTFNSPNWAKAILPGSEAEFRADGQHTSRVLSQCDDALFPQGLAVTVNTYSIDDPDTELAELFDLFDNPQSARSNAEKLGIYIAQYPDLLPLDRSYLNGVAHGIDYYYRDAIKAGSREILAYSQRQHGLYYEKPLHRQFALAFYALRESKHNWILTKPGLMAEIFADWQGHAQIALRFWREVMTESNPDVEDETRELATTLRDWAKKQPRVKQDKFRTYAKKIFDRYRRTHTAGEFDETPATVPALMLPEAGATGIENVAR